MSYLVTGKREQIEAAIIEAERFLKAANKAVKKINELEKENYCRSSCSDVAAAKRASMDLTRSLVWVRE
jgi:hypothetical protein